MTRKLGVTRHRGWQVLLPSSARAILEVFVFIKANENQVRDHQMSSPALLSLQGLLLCWAPKNKDKSWAHPELPPGPGCALALGCQPSCPPRTWLSPHTLFNTRDLGTSFSGQCPSSPILPSNRRAGSGMKDTDGLAVFPAQPSSLTAPGSVLGT